MVTHTHGRRRRCWTAIGLTACVTVGGCTGGPDAPKPSPSRVDASAFRAGSPGEGTASLVPERRSEPQVDPVLNVGRLGDTDVFPLRVTTGPAPLTGEAAPAPGNEGAFTLDSRVGQINGEPVFANELLEPLDGALRVAAIELADPQQWLMKGGDEVRKQLLNRVRNELILAEARANLTDDQRRSLPLYRQRIREDLIANEGGSAVAADDKLRQREGITLDEAVERRLDEHLVQNELRTQVYNRVVVPYQLVRLEYERRHDEFHPPAQAVFRLIMLRDPSDETVAEIDAQLAAGEPFVQVADRDDNRRWRSDEGRWLSTFRGDLRDHRAFAETIDAVNAAAVSLKPGEYAGPVRIASGSGTSVWWVYLEEIRRPAPIPLSAVQERLFDELWMAEKDKAAGQYFFELMSRSSFTPTEEMFPRLLVIASERYRPDALPLVRDAVAKSPDADGEAVDGNEE